MNPSLTFKSSSASWRSLRESATRSLTVFISLMGYSGHTAFMKSGMKQNTSPGRMREQAFHGRVLWFLKRNLLAGWALWWRKPRFRESNWHLNIVSRKSILKCYENGNLSRNCFVFFILLRVMCFLFYPRLFADLKESFILFLCLPFVRALTVYKVNV